jgi:two-component system chemotaxis response regulator CheB
MTLLLPPAPSRGPRAVPGVVVIAASMGGLNALGSVLAGIPSDFPAPIVVAQHQPRTGASQFAELLGRNLDVEVSWARSGTRLRAGHVYVAPPRRHLRLCNSFTCLLDDAPPEHFCRPAADPLFRSAAEHVGRGTIAVVLTGRLRDGAAGAAAVRRAGGVVIAQEPATCKAPGMPAAAIAAGAVHFVLPPTTIGAALVTLAMVPGADGLFGVGDWGAPVAA